MKITEFKLSRLNDYVTEKENEVKKNPFINTPFGMSNEGNIINSWMMNFNRLGLYYVSSGRNLFGKNEMIIISIPPTETGIHPLSTEDSFGWDGKINEYTAEMAVCSAFELISQSETSQFLKANKPSVDFSYIDNDGPGGISVKFNGEFWIITG